MKWKAKDGREIPIDELSDVHLANIMIMMARHAECYKWMLISEMWRYIDDAPEDAAKVYSIQDIMACQQEAYRLEEMDALDVMRNTLDTFSALEKECIKRGIEYAQQQ